MTIPRRRRFAGRRVLIHGTINHGTELKAPNSGRIPTSYFGVNSGISRAIRAKGDSGPIRLGILGLGAGVTASLARAGDTSALLRNQSLDPATRQHAVQLFSVLPGRQADPDGRWTSGP